MNLLIKNVRLIDGIHDFPERSDVFVTGDTVSAIGSFPQKRADAAIDGQGAWLSPGFVDIDTDSDHYLTLFNYPSQADFLKQGVTTIFGGMCGSSLAPLLYGGLESLQKWGDISKANVNWHTMQEFLSVIDKQPLALNFGTLAGHATIRRGIAGDDLRDITKNEKEVFLKVLEQALGEGAFGLSTGLGYVHARKTPESEIAYFAKAVKAANALYATHLRDMGKGVKHSIAETIKLAKDTGVRTLVNHFVPLSDAKKEYEAALGLIDALPSDCEFRFDMYPFDAMLVALYTFLPEWAQTGGLSTMAINVDDEWLSARIRKDLPHIDEASFVVAQASGNDILVGKSLADLREIYGASSTEDALLMLMRSTGLQATISYRVIDKPLARIAMKNPRSLIASNAPSFDVAVPPFRLKTERTTGTFTEFLSLVERDNLMPLRDAVRKLSYDSAKHAGLSGYGEIREGGRADFACFKAGAVAFTIVNGRIAMKDGEFQNVFAGKSLRHAA